MDRAEKLARAMSQDCKAIKGYLPLLPHARVIVQAREALVLPSYEKTRHALDAIDALSPREEGQVGGKGWM